MSKEMTDHPRLIEFAFPLKQASLDSVHEKNVRHGHISTLHIWPARRPLAACRAALIATLLPDPGTPEGRKELCEKIAGKVVKKIEKKKMPGGQVVEREKEETEGGILHWGRETENADTLEWFRQEIRKAYDGRVPKVLDPFAGGGAIPLEAMRLGCEATAIDINPVAWFILKCTLEYPQKLAGKTLPLPAFILDNEEFMTTFYKAHPHLVGRTKRTKKQQQEFARDMFMQGKEDSGRVPKADLAWHVRAWGQWVLDKARRELARFYPVYADFEPLMKDVKSYERQPMRLVPLKEDGSPDIDALNAEFGDEYLKNKANPRWVAKPTVAYLWARTVTCKHCRATIPLLKTRWLCKKQDGNRQRVLLTMEPNCDNTGVVFGIETDVTAKGSNAAQKREHDKKLGTGTMSRAGAKCPCCPVIMTMEDIRVRGKAKELGAMLTALAVDGPEGKEFRLPADFERDIASISESELARVFADVPFGMIEESIAGSDALGMRVPLYGLTRWRDMFSSRQLLALGKFVKHTRTARSAMESAGYPHEWKEAIIAYLGCGLDRVVDFANVNTQWKIDVPTINHALVRFAIQITWDFAEGNPVGELAGSYSLCLDRIAVGLETLLTGPTMPEAPTATRTSAQCEMPKADVIVTDPPYYDAIPYSDLMDWFYVWLRRTVFDVDASYQKAMATATAPKWDPNENDGELIDAQSRHGGDPERSKQAYEDGMANSFRRCSDALAPNGRLVIVFANKQPDAWETLVESVIRAGFIVEGSWPIQTEQPSRTRGISSAALASSVWLVCKKRHEAARPGWDNKVLEDMRANISQRLRGFWDAGIRGPDFVWAATGPALEAYSKHPVVKMANDPGQTLTVSEFLNHARRMVVDFVVGRVLEKSGEAAVEAAVDRLDEATAYYLLHRNDFGMEDAPVGACILYATACSLSDQELVRDWDLLVKTGDDESAEVEDETEGNEEPSEEPRSGSKVKLKPWNQRRGRSMGYEAPGGRPVPLIDRIHRLMHLWKGGDVHKVDEYLDEHGLRRHELFRRVLQSLIEISKPGSEERSLLESLSNHIGAKGAKKKEQPTLAFGDDE
jgi:adenine-specific DNA methylase